MKERVLSRIEELSQTLGDLLSRREQTIKDLRHTEADIDSISMVIFELKNLIDLEDHTSEIKD